MKFHETCPHCGQVTTAYTINLSERMIDAFRIFVGKLTKWLFTFNVDLNKWLLKWEIGLSNSQYSNRQNLAHFGIIKQEWQKWYLTDLGINFYNGNVTLLTPAWFMGWKTLPEDHPAWITHKPRKALYIREFEKQFQDQKEKYVEEKTKAVVVF